MTTAEIIKKYRQQAGISQEQMAELLAMSRLTYAGIESGKRDVKTKELDQIAQIFETSKEALLSTPSQPKQGLVTPDHPLYKMIQTVLYVLTKTAGKPNVGKIVLNKLLYFADFNHYEKYRSSITGDDYIKMPMGPVPKSIDGVLALMQQEGLINQITSDYHGYEQIRHIPNIVPDVTVLSGTETAELEDVIAMYGDKTGKRLTDYSHEDMPRKATQTMGAVIEYGLAHYRSTVYSVGAETNEGN